MNLIYSCLKKELFKKELFKKKLFIMYYHTAQLPLNRTQIASHKVRDVTHVHERRRDGRHIEYIYIRFLYIVVVMTRIKADSWRER
jgi:hypothetical protein